MATQKYNKLAGKHVLVIGGTSGIGFSVAEASLESGARVTISSSNPNRVRSSITSLQASYPHATITGHVCDLSQPSLESDVAALFEKTGKVDHIIFTAGDSLAQMPLSSITLPSLIAAGQIRFFAPLIVAKIGSKYLTPDPESSIVLTMGAVGERPTKDWSVIASYAAGLHGMTRNLALDLRPVRVNCVLTGRVGRPEDVAEAYLWLMKDSNVTGFVASSNAGSTLV
ncbi:NAD(P)-binding protein [Cadophora sp. DSE1049]|nr:NAD(P)-binding protein [Cadophora sp. DSE1049]